MHLNGLDRKTFTGFNFYFKETVKDFMSFKEIVEKTDLLFSSYFSVIQFNIHLIMFLLRSTGKVDKE